MILHGIILCTTYGCEVKNKSNDLLLFLQNACAQTREGTREHGLHVLNLICAREKQEKYDNTSLKDNYQKNVVKFDFFFLFILNMNHSVS